MFRKFALSLFAALLPLATTATVPDRVNLHNGYIIVFNHIRYAGEKSLDFEVTHVNHSTFSFITTRSTTATLRKDGYVTFNECCTVAGQSYELHFHPDPNIPIERPSMKAHARLCNIRGIPFGYAEVEIIGDITWIPNPAPYQFTGRYDVKNLAVRQIDTGCP